MKRSTARWTTAVGVAALLAVPSSGFAQTAAPPQTPPAASAQAQPGSAQEHLRKAEAAITAIPASSITAQDKTKINDLKQRITKLEALAAKPGATGWDKEVAAIDRVLTQLIGPASGAAATGTAGTAGKAAGSATLSAEARTQLTEVRTHITAFAAAMGKGSEPQPDAAAAQPPMTASTQPPSTTSASTSGTAGAVGTTGTQPPAQATEQPPATAPQAQGVDPDAAKKHLTAARNSLSEMTQLPAAAQLTGDARTQVTQLISNFNELITTNAQWRDSYTKVQANLTALIGAEATDESAARSTATGTAGAVGTSGTAGALDPAIRAKLVEFRSHLDKFEQAAGGAASAAATPDPAAAAANPPASATTTPPATATPPTTETPPASANPPATSSTMTTEQAQAGQMDRQEVLRHVQAIETLLQLSGSATPTGTSGSATATTQSGVTLTPDQVSQLKTHLAELKRLVEQK